MTPMSGENERHQKSTRHRGRRPALEPGRAVHTLHNLGHMQLCCPITSGPSTSLQPRGSAMRLPNWARGWEHSLRGGSEQAYLSLIITVFAAPTPSPKARAQRGRGDMCTECQLASEASIITKAGFSHFGHNSIQKLRVLQGKL